MNRGRGTEIGYPETQNMIEDVRRGLRGANTDISSIESIITNTVETGVGTVESFVPFLGTGGNYTAFSGTGAICNTAIGPIYTGMFSMFQIPFIITVNRMAYWNTSGGALTPAKASIVIYDKDGGFVGGFIEEPSTPGTVLNVVDVTEFILTPGEYYLGQAGNSQNTDMSTYQVSGPASFTVPASMFNVEQERIGTLVLPVRSQLPAGGFTPSDLLQTNLRGPVLVQLLTDL